MASISNWLWGTNQLDDAVDKATSELLPTGAEDVALNLEICDQIRSKSVSAKDAMRALKRRLNHKNPNVQLLALALTDVCVKNGGDHFLNEAASREFMDNLVSILKIPTLNMQVKNETLKFIQNWSLAFEGKTNLSYVNQVYKNLQNEGFIFPPKDLALANSAMVDTSTAPEWIDSDVCLRCRSPFSFTNRKHHCRNCGQVFDQQCSSKTMALPHFGITQPVRVCDGCYSKVSKKGEKSHSMDARHHRSSSMHNSRHASARELADAELQRAIQLSLEEIGSSHVHRRPGYVPSQPSPSGWHASEPPLVDRTSHMDRGSLREEEEDPDFKAAIEASLREANAPKPSAPVALETPRQEEGPFSFSGAEYSRAIAPPAAHPSSALPNLPSYDLDPLESDVILTFGQTVEQVQAQGGQDMARYPAMNELYDKANSLRPKLARSLDDAGRKEQILSEMHDKLSEAVKLYDRLLTEQVSHPTWIRPTYQSSSSARYTSNNGPYSRDHWNPSEPIIVPQQQYFSHADHSGRETQPLQPKHFSPASDHSDYQSQFFQPMESLAVQRTIASQEDVRVAGPSQQRLQYAESAQYTSSAPQPYAIQTPSFQQPPSLHANQSVSQLPYVIPSSQNQSTSSAVPTQPSPPPSSVRTQAFSSPHLPHSSTVASPTSSADSGPNPHIILARSNTVNASSFISHQRSVQSPPALPQFPVAPTSIPQQFDSYAHSMPSSVAQQERKEALLIDL